MRVFKEPNLGGGWKCPICGTAEKKEIALIPKGGTERGNIMKAEQYHLDCIDVVEYPHDMGRIALLHTFYKKGGE